MNIVKKERRFPKTTKNYVKVLLKIKGTIGGRDVTISIAPGERNNYISDEFANQLMIPESNIGEKLDFWDKKQYEISDLQLNIGDYTFISQFIVQSLWNDDGDIILGSTWMDTLDTFIFNTRKKFLTFSYKKKKITLQDVALRSKSEAPSAEDFKDISKLISQENQKSIQKMRKEVEKIVANKDDELTRLRSHNKDLLIQIRKLKNDKKALQETREQSNNKESQIDKETMAKLVEIMPSSEVQIETSEKKTDTVLSNIILNNKSPEVSKNEVVASVTSDTSVPYHHPNYKGHKQTANVTSNTSIPYRHPNHKNRQGQDENKQYSTYKPTNYNLEKERRQNQQLLWKPKIRNSIQTVDYQTIPMKVDLGWITSQKMQHISSGIRRLYRFVSSSVTVRSTEDFEKTLRARPRVKEKSYALRTKHFEEEGNVMNINNMNMYKI